MQIIVNRLIFIIVNTYIYKLPDENRDFQIIQPVENRLHLYRNPFANHNIHLQIYLHNHTNPYSRFMFANANSTHPRFIDENRKFTTQITHPH